jgi:Protein of unknown function (DUF3892)
MAAYRIVCVNKEYTHSHITQVGTGTKPDEYSRIWTVKEVREALESGDRFYTVSASTGKEADVRADNCHVNGCLIKTIRSTADAVTDNNLDNMVGCAV